MKEFDLLEKLKKQNAQVNPKFKASLKAQVLDKASQKGGSIFWWKYASLGLISFLGITIVGLVFFPQSLKESPEIGELDSTILDEIMMQESGSSEEATGEMFSLEEVQNVSDQTNGEYTHYRFSVEPGVAYSQCNLDTFDGDGIIEQHEFSRAGLIEATKISYYTPSGTLLWEYTFSSHYTARETFSADFPQDTLDEVNFLLLGELFNGSYGLNPEVNQNPNVEVTSQFTYTCNGVPTTIVKVGEYTPDSLDLEKVTLYIDSVAEENLFLSTTSYTIDSRDTEYSDVEGIFIQ